MQPLLRQIELEFETKLIPRKLSGTYKIEFDLDKFFTTDFDSLSNYMEKTIQSGIMTVNEWRIKRGMKPIEGGDTPMISCNVAPINSPKIRGEETIKVEG
ncbi:phage portal protein, HK97 family [Bacteroidales bacterium Barb4]|nr:phage portal protein, HK97 family [Bacteroidales bacterium Barb4]